MPCKLTCLIPARLTSAAQPAEPPCPRGDGHGHIAHLPLLLSWVILTMAAPRGVGSQANALVAPVSALGNEWQRDGTGRTVPSMPSVPSSAQAGAALAERCSQRWVGDAAELGSFGPGCKAMPWGPCESDGSPSMRLTCHVSWGPAPRTPLPGRAGMRLCCGAPAPWHGSLVASTLQTFCSCVEKSSRTWLVQPHSPSPHPLGVEKGFLQAFEPFFKGII